MTLCRIAMELVHSVKDPWVGAWAPAALGRRSCFSSGFGGGFRGFGNFRSGLNRPRWGWGYGGGGQAMPQDEVQALKQEASYLQNELDVVQKRLAELEGA